MASRQFKMIMAFIIIFTFGELAKADTKVLTNISLFVQRSTRNETISLENDKELVVKGLSIHRFAIPNDPAHILKSTIDYVADKNGYRANYTLVKEDGVNRLAIKTLQSLSG